MICGHCLFERLGVRSRVGATGIGREDVADLDEQIGFAGFLVLGLGDELLLRRIRRDDQHEVDDRCDDDEVDDRGDDRTEVQERLSGVTRQLNAPPVFVGSANRSDKWVDDIAGEGQSRWR